MDDGVSNNCYLVIKRIRGFTALNGGSVKVIEFFKETNLIEIILQEDNDKS